MSNPFDRIKQSTNITSDEIYDIAESVKHANLNDEQTVRQLIQYLAQVANRPISKTKENQIVEMILNNDIPMNMEELNNLF